MLAAWFLTVLAVAGSGLWIWRGSRGPPDRGAAIPSGDRPAIAVLPFTNLADARDAYFSDGLTEDIAGALAKFGELALIDTAASFAARDRQADLAIVGRDLGARYVVRGTVRRDGEQLRVTVQLVEAQTGTLRWSERYETALADVFKVQDDITRQLAGAMAVRLDQLEQARVASSPPESLKVYDLVLRGRQLMSEGTRFGNREARRILAEAIATDPSYAPAHAALGRALLDQAVDGWTEFREDAIAAAEREAHAALALDPGNAAASRVLGGIFLVRGQYDLALAELDRALAANPSDARSYEMRGDALMWSGEHAAAAEALEAAQRLNPGIGYGDLGMIRYLSGDYRDAVTTLTRGLPSERSPQARAFAIAALAAAHAQLGDRAAAERARVELATVSPFFDRDFFMSLFRIEADRRHLADGLDKAGIGS